MGKTRITAGNRKKLSWPEPRVFQRYNCRGALPTYTAVYTGLWGFRSCYWGSTFFTLFWRKTNGFWLRCWQNKRSLNSQVFACTCRDILLRWSQRILLLLKFQLPYQTTQSHTAVSEHIHALEAAQLEVQRGLACTHLFLLNNMLTSVLPAVVAES